MVVGCCSVKVRAVKSMVVGILGFVSKQIGNRTVPGPMTSVPDPGVPGFPGLSLPIQSGHTFYDFQCRYLYGTCIPFSKVL